MSLSPTPQDASPSCAFPIGEVAVADIGGTHARFALAQVGEGRVVSLGRPHTVKTTEYEGLAEAWESFGREARRPLPRILSIAAAGREDGQVFRFTNNPWTFDPSTLCKTLGIDRFDIINDFGAVAHAAAQLEDTYFQYLCGPDMPLPREGVISIVGPGTGLGVALLHRRQGHYDVIETEGGHIDFAPLDPVEDEILAYLRRVYGRVSIERVASGRGLRNIYDALAAMEATAAPLDEEALWPAALDSSDRLACVALERFFLTLGSAAGDIALAQGAKAVVIAGGLGYRLAARLPSSSFAARFAAKGRFERMMRTIPVKIFTHEQPGLFGVAAAYARQRYG